MTSQKEKILISTKREVKSFYKENELSHDDVLNFTVKTVVLGDESNDFLNELSNGINLIVKKTGALYLYDLSGQGNSIWFEPTELDFLKRARAETHVECETEAHAWRSCSAIRLKRAGTDSASVLAIR